MRWLSHRMCVSYSPMGRAATQKQPASTGAPNIKQPKSSSIRTCFKRRRWPTFFPFRTIFTFCFFFVIIYIFKRLMCQNRRLKIGCAENCEIDRETCPIEIFSWLIVNEKWRYVSSVLDLSGVRKFKQRIRFFFLGERGRKRETLSVVSSLCWVLLQFRMRCDLWCSIYHI